MTTAPEKLAYTIAEAAQATGLSRATLYRRIEAGDLVVTKIGARTLVRRAELERMLDAGTPQGAL